MGCDIAEDVTCGLGATVDELTFTCPLYPSKNQLVAYGYARTRHFRKRAYEEKIKWATLEAKIRGRHFLPLERAHVLIVLHFTVNRRRDVQNYTSAEWLLDALVRFGILADDSEKCIGTPVVEFGEVDAKRPRCEVTITVEGGDI